MSWPVGTLVMLVRVALPQDLGKIGTIVEGPGTWMVQYRNGRLGECYGYLVDFPGDDAGDGATVWHVEPRCLIPITPPGRADDVTRDEPIEVAS